jgi:hypothetical protein
MRRINLRLAIRQLLKTRGFTALNILGLTLGLTTFLLIVLYVADECSYAGIVALLSSDFLRLIAIAIIISSPLAWLGASRWLQNFAYRTTISGWLFVLAGGLVLLIAIATTIIQSVRAAIANPVESLRAE